MSKRKKVKMTAERSADRGNVVPSGLTLAGAERSKTHKPTNAAIPSDQAIDYMRKWSEERQQ